MQSPSCIYSLYTDNYLTVEIMNSQDKLVKLSRQLVFGSYALLLLFFTYMTIIAPPMEREANYVIWLMHILPLILFLPGMLRGNARTFIYLCFLLLFYFALSVANTFLPDYGWYPWVETALIIVLFLSVMMHTRWSQRQASEQRQHSQGKGAGE